MHTVKKTKQILENVQKEGSHIEILLKHLKIKCSRKYMYQKGMK